MPSASSSVMSGSLFLGTISSDTRSYLLRLLSNARKDGDYTKLIEPAAGAFAMAHLGKMAGMDPALMEASDVSVFSGIMGYAIMGKGIEEFDIKINVDVLNDKLDSRNPAHMLWAVFYIRLLNSSHNPMVDRVRVEALRSMDAQIEQLDNQLERARATLGGMVYRSMDIFEHLDMFWDDPRAIIVANPPTYTGGFEKYYDFKGLLEWDEPKYDLFDEEASLFDLWERGKEACGV